MPDPVDGSSDQQDIESKAEGFRKDLSLFVVAPGTTGMPMVYNNAGAPAFRDRDHIKGRYTNLH